MEENRPFVQWEEKLEALPERGLHSDSGRVSGLRNRLNEFHAGGLGFIVFHHRIGTPARRGTTLKSNTTVQRRYAALRGVDLDEETDEHGGFEAALDDAQRPVGYTTRTFRRKRSTE